MAGVSAWVGASTSFLTGDYATGYGSKVISTDSYLTGDTGYSWTGSAFFGDAGFESAFFGDSGFGSSCFYSSWSLDGLCVSLLPSYYLFGFYNAISFSSVS